MIIGVDFDGTCVTHEYPVVGKDIGAVPVLKQLVKNGHQLILFTMRGNADGGMIQDAIDWFKDNEIPLYGINKNPTQHMWTNSPKAYCQLYIDDAALGVPLIYPYGERPYVNWNVVHDILVSQGIIK
jgi:hypothetical protein